MIIGITYDLRDDYKDCGLSKEQLAEFDSEQTIKGLEDAIKSLGYEAARIGNVKNLIKLLNQGQRWDLVFNIAEGLHGIAREAQVPTILDIYQIPYTFSDAATMITTLDKSLAKMIVKEAGIITPEFAVVNKITDIAKINLRFPLFAKPLAEGTGKGISAKSHIKNQQELELVCKKLLEQFNQPVLVETFLSGREFTVGIIGSGSQSRSIGALEVILKNGAEEYCHSYHNKENCEQLVEYKLAKDDSARKAEDLAIKAWKALNCKDAGRIDIRCDENGQPHFLEANPLSGLNETHSDLPILANQAGIYYKQLIAEIIQSAIKRYQI